MKQGMLFFVLLFIIRFDLKSQNDWSFQLHFSPNLSSVLNYIDYNTLKPSYSADLKIMRPVSPKLNFVGGFGFLNTGVMDKRFSNEHTRQFNFATITAGSEFKLNSIAVTFEAGPAIFLYHSFSRRQEDYIYKEIYFHNDIDSGSKARSLSIFTKLIMAYNFQIRQRTYAVGVSSYYFVQEFATNFREERLMPFGIGLNLGFPLGQ